MATDRRRFLSLMALGVPATAHAIWQEPAPPSPAKALIEEDGNYESALLLASDHTVREKQSHGNRSHASKRNPVRRGEQRQ